MTHPDDKIDFAALLPSIGVFGGVRRFIEIGNELVRRGHAYTVYHPDGDAPSWIEFDGEVRRTNELASSRHQVLMCNDPPSLQKFEEARADVKCFYFALENIAGEKEIARHAGWTILANSTGMHDRLRRRYGVQAEKVIGGINLDVFKPTTEPTTGHKEYRILTFGRFSRKKKGARIVVKAAESFARAVGGDKSVKLVLFDHLGRHNERDPREEIRCGIPYEFHIDLTQDELARLYASCDLFVSAEKRAGWANTAAEAMACGVPVVCTRSGTRDIAAHLETAWVVRWRHPFFIGRGISALYSDADMARRHRDNALERIRRFSWTHVVDQLERVVRRRLQPTP
jgi:glycosyltransferase involved in cell wall biosynthesis